MTVDLTALRSWRPTNAEQALLKAEFVEHADASLNPASRECLPDHLTASALVLTPNASRVLLCLHRKVGLWLQFGGHIEQQDASLGDAALREAREESGIADLKLVGPSVIQLDRHPAPCQDGARHHLDVQFLALTQTITSPVVSEESLDVRWFGVDALPDQTDDAVRRLVETSVRSLNETVR